MFKPVLQLVESCTCNIRYIARRLGREHYGDKRLVAHVQALCDNHGFPPPFPTEVKGKGLTTDVRKDSRWRRDAVEHWFDTWLPPEIAAMATTAERDQAARQMDERAANLQLARG